MVEYIALKRTFALHKEEYEQAALRALDSGWYILGQEGERFEAAFAAWLGRAHCVGVNSGTDALILAFRALGIGPGDEVIVPANTYIASVIGITENGGTPVFADVGEDLEMDPAGLEEKITPRTRAILAVHLYGHPCRMDEIAALAEKHGLFLVEDCAQCHGAEFRGKKTGTFGAVACFSFYPTKPLGALGDAGALATDDPALAERLRMLRNYGSKVKYHNEINGINSRMDEVQAACLQVGLKHLEEGNAERGRIAARYLAEIRNDRIRFPLVREDVTHAYHLFPVFCDDRDRLQSYLLEKGVKTQVHYPIPPYVADCYRDWGYAWEDFPNAARQARTELSLPVYAGMPEEDVDRVIRVLNEYR